ncbi:hypothetical protein RHCRD62_60276 [Rhodococcus sp. RD6.2]|nr:hypothetical protein RHCRD62_60276 [Rhodococcus sp. RD6.2]
MLVPSRTSDAADRHRLPGGRYRNERTLGLERKQSHLRRSGWDTADSRTWAFPVRQHTSGPPETHRIQRSTPTVG